MIMLSDLDTPFPSSTSTNLKLLFSNNSIYHVKTNLTIDKFKRFYLNKEIVLSYSYFAANETAILEYVSL